LTWQERRRREALRLRAAEWFDEGVRAYGQRVARLLARGWGRALRSAGHSGSRPLLSEKQFTQVAAVAQQGPAASGFVGGPWTLAPISRVITEVTGAIYRTPGGVRKLLRRHGRSHHLPAKGPAARRGGGEGDEPLARRSPAVSSTPAVSRTLTHGYLGMTDPRSGCAACTYFSAVVSEIPKIRMRRTGSAV